MMFVISSLPSCQSEYFVAQPSPCLSSLSDAGDALYPYHCENGTNGVGAFGTRGRLCRDDEKTNVWKWNVSVGLEIDCDSCFSSQRMMTMKNANEIDRDAERMTVSGLEPFVSYAIGQIKIPNGIQTFSTL